MERILDPADVYAVTQGFKKITVESVATEALNPDEVFAAVEKSRSNGTLAEKITKAGCYYEVSRERPGMLDRVNTETGERQTGHFYNGKFIPA